jgi:hypothetical protein
MFKELYYRLHKLLKKLNINDNPEFNAFIGISFFQCINILSLWVIINYLLNLDISMHNAIYSGVFLYVSLTTVNFFVLFKKKKVIKKKYDQLSTERQNKGKLYFWIYVVLSLMIFFVSVSYFVTPKS